MKSEKLVISFDGCPLVVVEYDMFRSLPDLLDWYSKKYAFERKKLSCSIVQEIPVEEFWTVN